MTTDIAEPINEYRITDHAAFEMARRGITGEVVHSVLTAPEQPNRCVAAGTCYNPGSTLRGEHTSCACS